MSTNQIGLDNEKSKQLVAGLNQLLADYMMFYQNTRALHWNVRGEKFFELHAKFEELYNNLLLKVDEIAERILTLGGSPLHTFEDYIQTSTITPLKSLSDGERGVRAVLESLKVIIISQRELLKLSANVPDESTNAIMSDYIREQEKLVWMYSAYVN